MVELLSPARDLTCLITAINYGADAVYCGLKELNMRANATNFTRKELIEGVKYAHKKNKKVYLCLNTVIYEKDLRKAEEILKFAKDIEIDAVIISDLGTMQMAKELGLRVHASVQCNITNSLSAKFYANFAKRIVLSRELTLAQIREIKEELKKQKIDLELEGFVHGALCVAISGRCFLSAYLFGKHANCGECMQPCRRKWKLINEHHDGTYEVICEGKYLLSPKDLCMIEYIPQLIKVFDSFKIEGRSKNAEYVMITTKVYREAIDSVLDGTFQKKLNFFKEELKKVYNRDYDTGFYFRDINKTYDFQYKKESNLSPYRKIEIGKVLNFYKKINVAEIELYKDLKIGDTILIIGKTTGCVKEKVESMQINHKNITIAKKGERVGIKLHHLVREGDKVYLFTNSS